MINSDEFSELQEVYLDNETTYDESNTHFEQAKLVLEGVQYLDQLNRELSEKHADSRHRCQQMFLDKGINGVLSIHFLTKNQFYDSAYRDIRTVLETFLILNYMNEHKIETSRKFWRQEAEIRDSELDADSKKWSWERMYTEGAFHDMLGKEKSRMFEHNEDLKRIFNYFSNRNVHPTRVDGFYNDRTYQRDEEKQLIEWQLDLLLGMMIQAIKLYSDTPDYQYTKDQLDEIVNEIIDDHQVQPFVDLAIENFPD